MKTIATKAYFTGARALICLSVLALGGCMALQPKPRATVYDFGPGPVATAASTRMAPLPTLVLAATGDRLVSYHCSEAIARRLGLAIQVHRGEGNEAAGHDLPIDAPDWVCSRMNEWLCTLPSAAAKPKV